MTLIERLNDAADLIACESQCDDPLADDLYKAAELLSRMNGCERCLELLRCQWLSPIRRDTCIEIQRLYTTPQPKCEVCAHLAEHRAGCRKE